MTKQRTIEELIEELNGFVNMEKYDPDKGFLIQNYAAVENHAIYFQIAMNCFLTDDEDSVPFFPYKIETYKNSIFIFSFVDFVEIKNETVINYNSINYRIMRKSGQTSRKFWLQTECGIVEVLLYLTVFDSQELNKSVDTYDTVILEVMNESNFKSLEFELLQLWAKKVGNSITTLEFLTGQSGQKNFYAWFNSLKIEKALSEEIHPTYDKIIKNFILKNENNWRLKRRKPL